MNILHISTLDYGGAGLAALRLHNAMKAAGVNSKMLVEQKKSYSDEVYAVESNLNEYKWSAHWIVRKIQKHILRRLGFVSQIEKYYKIIDKIPLEKRTYYTLPVTHYDVASHPLVEQADIIHLHWVANFVDYETFFAKIDKPIVWTFQDENIGYGGFHYTKNYDKYISFYKDIEDEFVSIKRNGLAQCNNMTVVAVSKQMNDFLSNKSLIGVSPLTIIPNMVDCTEYKSLDKKFARSVFNIAQEDLVFVFCSVDLNDDRKGLKEIIRALNHLQLKNVTLLCIGQGTIKSDNLSFNVYCTGSIQNEKLMALAYSSGDYFLMPSFQEAFAQTSIESMACGLPIIAFPCSGIEDLVDTNNGVICADFTVEALIDGIKTALSRQYNHEEIRNYVLKYYSSEVITGKYLSVYHKVLESTVKEL